MAEKDERWQPVHKVIIKMLDGRAIHPGAVVAYAGLYAGGAKCPTMDIPELAEALEAAHEKIPENERRDGGRVLRVALDRLNEQLEAAKKAWRNAS